METEGCAVNGINKNPTETREVICPDVSLAKRGEDARPQSPLGNLAGPGAVESIDSGPETPGKPSLRGQRVSFAASDPVVIDGRGGGREAVGPKPSATKANDEGGANVAADDCSGIESERRSGGSQESDGSDGDSSGSEASQDSDPDGDDGSGCDGADDLRKSLAGLPSGWMGALLAGGKLGPKPLHAAAAEDDVEQLELLLGPEGEFHGNVDAHDPFDYTPLIVAAESGSAQAVALLLKLGADKEAATKLHNSRALHYACMEGWPNICRLLLDAGCDIDPRTDDLRTPLFQAAFRNKVECVRILIDAGAELVPARDGRTPIDVATDDAVRELLKSAQPARKKARSSDP